jgi:hypothetical protein
MRLLRKMLGQFELTTEELEAKRTNWKACRYTRRLYV